LPEIELVVSLVAEDRRYFQILIMPRVGNLEVVLLLTTSALSVEDITD
jgi:hypothetical protein